MSTGKRPHRLELYEHAVQQPRAEAALLARMYAAMNGGEEAALLREDFAGTCAVAAAWCESHPEADGHGESFPCFHFKHPKFREQFEPKSEL